MILISIDTLRQDHLGCYGYGRKTSPNIDRFAEEEGILFSSAYAQAPYTLTSHMSMLTGLYPEAHGILTPVASDNSLTVARLKESVPTLADSLKANGFFTSAFTDGIFMNKKYGFDQGFDEYRDERNPTREKNGFQRYRYALYQWIRSHSSRDFFLFLHTYDTHSPYLCPNPFRERFKNRLPADILPSGSMQFCSLLGYHQLHNLSQYSCLQDVVDVYDGCISFVDHELGRLFALLKDEGLWDEALIVITSDHGESFMENRLLIGHGMCATNEEICVPLIMKLPGSRLKGRIENHTVEVVDIMPTILSALGIPVPRETQGQNLLKGLDKGKWNKNYAFGVIPYTGNSRYLIQNDIKYIEAVSDSSLRMIKVGLLPSCPSTCERPEDPYFTMKNKPYYYDFDLDPLGIKELIYRGDRAYDLSNVDIDWKAKEVLDIQLLRRYKMASYSISGRSKALSRRFRGDDSSGITFSEKDMEELQALGYAGLNRPSSSDDLLYSGGELKLDVILTPPLVERTLLDRGDEFLWKISLLAIKKNTSVDIEELNAMRIKAQKDYKLFLKLHPDKKRWVEWRMKCLDLSPKVLDEIKNKKGTKKTTKQPGKQLFIESCFASAEKR